MGQEVVHSTKVEAHKHPITRAQDRLFEALAKYMELREKLGGHVSTEGRELAAAWRALQALRKEPVCYG